MAKVEEIIIIFIGIENPLQHVGFEATLVV